jgi:hypothetical protein
MTKLFNKNDVIIIEGSETLNDNQLDVIKGGISDSLLDCSCPSENQNFGQGNCTCDKKNKNAPRDIVKA